MSAVLCLGAAILHSHREEEKESFCIVVWSAMKSHWHESGNCLICIWNNSILFNLIYVWAFNSNGVEQFVPAGGKGCLLQKGYLSFTIPLGVPKETVKILLLGAICHCPNLCTKRSSRCWRTDSQRLIWGSDLDALKWRCFWPLKIFSDPSYHSFLLLIGHFKVWIPTISKDSMHHQLTPSGERVCGRTSKETLAV